MTDGVCGSCRSNHADLLDEYADPFYAPHDPAADQDDLKEDPDPAIGHSNTSTPRE